LFASEGAKVVLADIQTSVGAETARKIKAAGGEAVFAKVDVSNAADVDQLVRTALDTYAGIDVLFNGAAILLYGTALDTDEKAWNRLMSVNLTGTFLCSKAVLPHMVARGGGSIINVSSTTGGHDATAKAVAYVASKGGVAMLTKAMAIDHAKQNIRINALCPGPTDTPMLRSALTPAELEAFAASFPMGRLGRPEELAQAALVLASDESSFVTGSLLTADGGQTAAV
jgi:NAD(P)-dependent dehydrogenase (short-subunit alcohol dehydrogenase family)